jgi:purine-nucleoside phosphorylase
MPIRLRPTAPIAADAILVGDPGRALMLAQELLERPRMSNHARGLWGYSGRTVAGSALTIQATGIGGPSAALVLGDLAKLGVRRAIRIGTCHALDAGMAPGELLLVSEAVACGGSAAAFGVEPGDGVRPDPSLAAKLRGELGERARPARIGSFDTPPVAGEPPAATAAIAAADMQTVAVLARGAELGTAVAAVLVVSSGPGEAEADQVVLEEGSRRAGIAASNAYSQGVLEG